MENWKTIKNYPEYEISDRGRVKSLKYNKTRIMTLTARSGYLRVELNNTAYSVHRLVCDAFLEKPTGKDRVNHINGIKSDNKLCNLEWCTDSENIRHAISTGLKKSSKGESNGQSKLKETQIIEIRNSSLSYRVLGRIYGVDKSIIGDVKRRETWNHI